MTTNSPGAAAFLEDLIDASKQIMKYEGRMMKWGSWSGAFSSFIIHPSSFFSLLRLTAASPDLLAIIKKEGKV